ncbi:DUF4169 family protein [Palleronia sp. KMU-117]|uniref:DUF4169 family protein n=1 Tax=Palleronia sp. KMU-117 TaxID=3434108 RepID=UPI003D74E2D3
MAGKVINLNQARKARAKAQARTRAGANAAKHGRTRAEREADEARALRETERLEAHRRQRIDEDDGA